MIVAFSTSSPLASVAAFAPSGDVLWQGERPALHQASGVCLDLLSEMRRELGFGPERADAFAADLGPGSFTGVRVGVILAKTFAFIYGRPVMGADAFDLIDPQGIVVLPSKRGEFFVRRPGEAPVRTADLPAEPFLGFGPGLNHEVFPLAARFGPLLTRLPREDAVLFAPKYLIEPSISIPKVPYGLRPGGSNG
ncbi:tRNA (adenosine(37)-N6)-threonylcarbamoyltransferase complex dimerization subunit type 1 TsaB [Fimbriimonas ginsengisoli]|uniref:Glycoprotease family protein n=1 Tax=Fimbriimonas ginsengisoli Gsoil 348 TaxID=661478 RepID=A0A068NYL6_FIMGI|nr:tRNA (adenosine(37)-N6)-threonylcarbamoyltransferase complex dimerization subunit type 1 TsaB [Fimbriimonas ginsengisoli]AIE87039.1 glycoprotease family protein [Fimbriimonas ginsengisoli Gsoil 348]